MKFDPRIYHRRSIRLKGYDYSQVGMYFATICTEDKKCYFGDLVGGKVELSTIGESATRFWHEIPGHYNGVQTDAFVVMPNHVHGIVFIGEEAASNTRNEKNQGVIYDAPTKAPNHYSKVSPGGRSLSTIIGTFKSAVSRWCGQNGHGHFRWQRNYYEHVIRNEEDLTQIREYISNNPLKWDLDEENPKV